MNTTRKLYDANLSEAERESRRGLVLSSPEYANWLSGEREKAYIMRIKGTMERLMNHMDVLAELKQDEGTKFRAIMELERFITQDVDDLKVAIMTHAFDALDYFAANQGIIDENSKV